MTSVTTDDVTTAYSYDGHGRMAEREIANGDGKIISISYEYRNIDGTNATTGQIKELTIDASGFSFSISGVAIVGNEDFTTPRSYEQSFTSVGTGFGKARVGVAYSDTGYAFSVGYNLFGGNKIVPPICVSKTYYKLEQTYVIPIQHS